MNSSASSHPSIVLTGGGGFLGQNVVKFLAARGLRGTILDLKAPTDATVANILQSGQWSFHRCDFSAPETFPDFAFPTEPVYVMHLASKVHTSNAVTLDVAHEIHTQVGGIFPLLDHLGAALQGVAFTSTIETYGVPIRQPIDENHPTEPFNIYGAAKLALEYFLDIYCRSKNIPLARLRLPQIYGPGDTYAKAIPTFIKNCLAGRPSSLINEGADLREFIHVDDIALALALAMEKRADGVFNVTGGQSVSIAETLRLIQAICGTRIPPSNTPSNKPQLRYAFDTSKAGRELGYAPAISFESGLRTEVQWFKDAAQ